ncbi:MAG TPA: hypothetical protein VEU96_06575 [Bryobacteraceae bacterium]|nr:hypothetical protein [Bryobacteraceae bacterium]
MKAILQLLGSIVDTIAGLFGKATWPVRVLIFFTFVLVPGSMLFQILYKKWIAHSTGYRQSAMDAIAWRPGFRAKHESRNGLIQTAQEARESYQASYEYSLYGFIVLLTVLAIVFYVAGSRDQQISSLNIYAGAVYFGLLGWAFHRLNAIYRRRKMQQADLPGMEGTSAPRELIRDDGKTEREAEQELARIYAAQPARSVMGLSSAQLTIAVVVFLAACLTFTWAWSNLR